MLPSYVRTTAPEFDLIFPRKEIKRKWPTGGARLFFRKPLKIFETVAVTLHCRLSKIFPPSFLSSLLSSSRFQLKRILNDSRLINCALANPFSSRATKEYNRISKLHQILNLKTSFPSNRIFEKEKNYSNFYTRFTKIFQTNLSYLNDSYHVENLKAKTNRLAFELARRQETVETRFNSRQ